MHAPQSHLSTDVMRFHQVALMHNHHALHQTSLWIAKEYQERASEESHQPPKNNSKKLLKPRTCLNTKKISLSSTVETLNALPTKSSHLETWFLLRSLTWAVSTTPPSKRPTPTPLRSARPERELLASRENQPSTLTRSVAKTCQLPWKAEKSSAALAKDAAPKEE